MIKDDILMENQTKPVGQLLAPAGPHRVKADQGPVLVEYDHLHGVFRVNIRIQVQYIFTAS